MVEALEKGWAGAAAATPSVGTLWVQGELAVGRRAEGWPRACALLVSATNRALGAEQAVLQVLPRALAHGVLAPTPGEPPGVPLPAPPVGGSAAPSLCFSQASVGGESKGEGRQGATPPAPDPGLKRRTRVLPPCRPLCKTFYLFLYTEFCFPALSAQSSKSEGKGDFWWVLGPGDGSWHPGGQSGASVDVATGSSTPRSKAVKLPPSHRGLVLTAEAASPSKFGFWKSQAPHLFNCTAGMGHTQPPCWIMPAPSAPRVHSPFHQGAHRGGL